MFGLPTGDDGSRNDVMFAQSLVGNTHYEPDFAALRAAPTRIVIGVGEESDGEMAHRGGEAVAARLGLTPVVFPSGHGGFLGGEYGQTGKPDEFAATAARGARRVLTGGTRGSRSRGSALRARPACGRHRWSPPVAVRSRR